MTISFSKDFNNVLKGVQNVPITTCVQMTFYRVNDYFFLGRKDAVTCLSGRALYPNQISAELAAYEIRENSHNMSV